ncbi:MAG: 1-acyl-sn-glycerol-3-phosphate acyltransferase, partial [Bacteroidetes bacterium]|nr:1-acyl-sn-glycerol-3-phosphate acyltransferase [Bacteroidota bacterium]
MPFNKPVILAPNHNNGFIDPMIIGMLTRQKVRFFARGDVFKGKMAKWILNQLSVSPMYRLQEGYSEIKKNDKTFEECRRLLKANKTLLIFPEAICIQERRLHPLKKGLTRIAFQSLESFDYSKDIIVIPIGINYQSPTKFRSKVFIEIGDPISVKEYEKSFKEDKVKTINNFTKRIEQELMQLMHHIDNKNNDIIVDGIEEIYSHQWLVDKHLNSSEFKNHVIASTEIIEMVNTLDKKEPELIAALNTQINEYINLLNKNKLRDHLLREENINKMNIWTFILEYVIIYLGYPVYLLG